MQKILFLLLITFAPVVSVLAQNENSSLVSEKARPIEGIQTFMEQFIEKFNYKNADKVPNDITEIKLRVKFIVEKDGTFNDINLVDDTYNFQKEVERVFSEMPIWKPAVY